MQCQRRTVGRAGEEAREESVEYSVVCVIGEDGENDERKEWQGGAPRIYRNPPTLSFAMASTTQKALVQSQLRASEDRGVRGTARNSYLITAPNHRKQMSRTPATYPGCLSISALFYTPVTDPETLFIGAHHCSLDDCSLAQEILPGFGYTVL